MNRSLPGAFLALALAACSSQEKLSVEPAPNTPPTAPELAQLERFVGTWSGTSEVVTTSQQAAAKMKEMMPADAGSDGSGSGTSTAQWMLGGKVLQRAGWYEIGPDMRAEFVEIFVWDDDANAFRNWFISEIGESGEVTMTPEKNGEFTMTGNVIKGDGTTLAAGGTFTFADDKADWTWFEDDPSGRTQYKGTVERGGKKFELKPAKGPAPEMAPLAPFAGKWKGTSTLIEPTPEEMTAMMKKEMRDFEGKVPVESPYEETIDWILGGKCMRKRGWMEWAPGMRQTVLEYIVWDPAAGRFHLLSFMDSGEFGEGWITPSADGKSFDMTFEGTMNGEPTNGSGKMTVQDADTMTWTWTGSAGSTGTMKMKGISSK